ncbi:tRNA (adenine(22)-N(1))-methyltransferase [Pelotomaculum propionicicum]|uniref:tRNA (adenine(22)-N(1))-methyltransferase n=1 Tax=Pelotomaculum propionicicum TaxID=258475 RepID=UPI003B778A3A
MELAKRLAAAAEYVPAGSVAADIGTDHAYLPIYLVEAGICRRVIATELRPGPFRSALRKVDEHKLNHKVDLRLGDGLKAINPSESDVIVLAGMGGNTIREILSASPEVLSTVKMLILQPMADPGDLRSWLAANGWRIYDERLVEENGKIYVIIAAVPGCEEVKDSVLLELGPRLAEKKDPLFGRYLEIIKSQYERALAGMRSSNSAAAREKALETENKLAGIRRIAGCQ